MSHFIETIANDNRNRLLRAAVEIFMEEGYGASMDRIASRAGMARQTLYNHFACKNDLFSEVAHMTASAILVSLEGDAENIREHLLRFGTILRQKALRTEGLAMFRTLSAEAHRFPDLALAVLEKGPEQTARRLTEFLALAMDEGTLMRDDPRFVAEMLISMLDGFDRTRGLLGAPLLSGAQEQARVTRIVDCFLLAYGPEKQRR